jgi:hypothetical protein
MNQTLTEIVFCQTEDGQVKIDTVLQNETMWLTQAKMAELFDVNIPAISKHLKNNLSTSSRHSLESGEFDDKVVVSILENTIHNGNFHLRGSTYLIRI